MEVITSAGRPKPPLMSSRAPSTFQGLMEICKTRPEDPIDYLAEYLFQQNPKLD